MTSIEMIVQHLTFSIEEEKLLEAKLVLTKVLSSTVEPLQNSKGLCLTLLK